MFFLKAWDALFGTRVGMTTVVLASQVLAVSLFEEKSQKKIDSNPAEPVAKSAQHTQNTQDPSLNLRC